MIKQIANKLIDNIVHKQEYSMRCAVRRQFLEDKIINCDDLGISSEKYNNQEIIVSLTTYGRRLNWVAYTIESIMQQTIKANRIILWIAPKDFELGLPSSLRLQQKRGLEIYQTPDIRSYKKIIPTIKKHPDSVIITIDDDVMYDFDILGAMIDSYNRNPNHIHACRCHVIQYDANGKMKPYKNWEWDSFDYQNNINNFFTGVGGVLYPPRCLDPEVLNESVFMDICKMADDVWLNAMARKVGTIVDKVPTRSLQGKDFLAIDEIQDMGLNKINVNQNLNDMQIKSVFEKYSLMRIFENNKI